MYFMHTYKQICNYTYTHDYVHIESFLFYGGGTLKQIPVAVVLLQDEKKQQDKNVYIFYQQIWPIRRRLRKYFCPHAHV
jgi:hypothetical protein